MSTGLISTTRGRIVPLQNMTKRSKALNVAPYLSAGAYLSSLSVTKATAMFYADSNGVWFVDMTAVYSGNLATAQYHIIALAGVVFEATTNNYQQVTGWVDDSTYMATGAPTSFVFPNTGNISVGYGATVTGESGKSVYLRLCGVQLNAEPTWTSLGTTWAAIAETVGDVTAYIPPCAAATSGIINNDPTNTAGNLVLGRTSGVAVPAGYVGEVITGSATVTNYTYIVTRGLNVYGADVTLTLNKGVYLLYVKSTCNTSDSDGLVYLGCKVTVGGAGGSTRNDDLALTQITRSGTSNQGDSKVTILKHLSITSDSTAVVLLTAALTGTVPSISDGSWTMTAVRIV